MSGPTGSGAVLPVASGADAVAGGPSRPLLLDPAPLGELQALHGRDGYVLLSEEPVPDTRIEVWVVRVGMQPQRYSIDVELLNTNGRAEAVLVDGAVVVARGGSLAILRAEDGLAGEAPDGVRVLTAPDDTGDRR